MLGGGLGAGVLAFGTMAVVMAGPAQRSVRLSAQTVTIDPVRSGAFHDITTLQGKVVPRDVIYLDALEGGQVQKLLVQAGDRITQGQPLVVFRNTQLELDVLSQEGRLVESLTQLQTNERQLEQARAENEKALEQIDYNILRLQRMDQRRQKLLQAGYVARETTDQIRDELEYDQKIRPVQQATNERQEALRRQQVPKIRAEQESLQQSLAITKAKMDDLTVRAPATGRLTAMDLKIGQIRNRGERLGEITLDNGFKINAAIDEYYLGRVAPAQTARIEIDGKGYRLKVTRIYPQVQNGTFSADLEFVDAPPATLTPGEAVQGTLSLGVDRPAELLPAGAFLERSGGDWVFVVTADGRHAERRRIKAGRRNSEQLEVLSGLRPGERVITSDYTGLEKIDRIDLTS
jgi:HlyD family secretion protein